MKFTPEIRVGFMAFVSLLIFASMVFMVGDVSFLTPSYNIIVKFHHVDGLLIGSKVALSGVKVGKVESIAVKHGMVYVTIKLGNEYKIPNNAIFTIDTMGLMGEKMVGIEIPPEGEKGGYIKNNSEITGIDPVRMSQLMSDGQKILGSIRTTTESINDIIGDKKFGDAIKNSAYSIEDTVATINMTAKGIDDRLDEMQGKVEKFLDHLDNVGFQVSDLIDESRTSVLDSVENINGFTKDLKDISSRNKKLINKMLSDFQKTAERLKKLISDIEHNGTTARDLRTTLSNIRESSKNMEKITDEIRRVFDDGTVREDLKESTHRLRSILGKTDKFLSGKGGFLKTKMGYSSIFNTEEDYFVNDVDMDMDIFGYKLNMGVRNIGHGSELDFQIGTGPFKKIPGLTGRFGVIKSKMGFGLDYKWKNAITKIDVIDTQNTKVDTTTLYNFWENMDLLSRTEDILSSDREYNVGVRYHF
jgi:phospholipid/cholesterol/gamma-HCH transport system substrate-binding protein